MIGANNSGPMTLIRLVQLAWRNRFKLLLLKTKSEQESRRNEPSLRCLEEGSSTLNPAAETFQLPLALLPDRETNLRLGAQNHVSQNVIPRQL